MFATCLAMHSLRHGCPVDMLPSSSSLLPPSLQQTHKSAVCMCEPIALSMSDLAPSMDVAKAVGLVHQIVGAMNHVGKSRHCQVWPNIAAIDHMGNQGIGVAWQREYRDSLLGKKPPPLPGFAPG